jgi:Fe-S cluster assembly iron-binding protein IscA
LGLALDESENSRDFKVQDNGIDILLDNDIKRYIETGAPITVDFKTTPFGSGFFVGNGSAC